METAMKEAIERLTSGNDGQFVIVCTPTTESEKTIINGVLLDQPNNPYMIHLLETRYEELPTCILLNCNYADGEDFFTTLTVVHKILKYPMEKIHFICNRNIPIDCEMNPDIIENHSQILKRRVELFQSMDEEERKKKYFGGELILIG